MKGTDIFSVKAISKKVKNKKLGGESTISNNLYYLLNKGATGINSELINEVINIVESESALLVSELKSLQVAVRKPRTTKKKAV